MFSKLHTAVLLTGGKRKIIISNIVKNNLARINRKRMNCASGMR